MIECLKKNWMCALVVLGVGVAIGYYGIPKMFPKAAPAPEAPVEEAE